MMQIDQGLSTNANWFRKQSCIPEILIAKTIKVSDHSSTLQNLMHKITEAHVVCIVQNTKLTNKQTVFLSQTTTKNLHFHPYIHKSNTH